MKRLELGNTPLNVGCLEIPVTSFVFFWNKSLYQGTKVNLVLCYSLIHVLLFLHFLFFNTSDKVRLWLNYKNIVDMYSLKI